MPLFMLISGYLYFYSFSKRNLKELLIHRTQALLQPLVFCSIFSYLVTTVLFGLMKGNFEPIFNSGWLVTLSSPSFWFLWSVLSASLVVSIVCKKCNNIFLQISLLIIAIPVVAMFPNGDNNVYMYPYFVLGFYFAKVKDQLPNIVHKLKYICLPLFPILLLFYEKKHYIYTTGIFPIQSYSIDEILLIDAYRWIIGLCGSLFVITVLQLIYKHLILKLKRPILSTALSKMGIKSIQIYTFSVPFLSTYLSVFFPRALSLLNMDNIFVKNMFVYNFIFTLALSVAYAFALYLIIKIFDKLKITKIMFGR